MEGQDGEDMVLMQGLGRAGQMAETKTLRNKQTNKPTINGKLERIIFDLCTGDRKERERERTRHENNANIKAKCIK